MAGLTLRGVLALDGSGWDATLRRAQGGVSGLVSRGINPIKNAIAGAFTVGAIASLTRETIGWAGHLRDVADSLNVSTDFLQKMENAAKRTGGSLEDVKKFTLEVNKSRGEAVNDPGGKAAQAFGRMGISPDQVKNLGTEAFIQKVIEQMKSGFGEQGMLDLQEIGGRASKNLLAAFVEGFDSTIPIVAEDVINQLDAVGDSFTDLKQTLMATVAPALTFLADKLRGFVNQIGQFGAMLGGAHEAALQGSKDDASKGVGFWGRFANVFSNMWNGAQDAQARVAADQQDEQDARDIDRAKEQTARNERRRKPPDFALAEKLNLKKEAAGPKAPPMRSDQLLQVGNFLGAGRDTLARIGEQTNLLLKELVDLAKLGKTPGQSAIEFPSA